MRCRALVVPTAEAETARRRLRDAGWLQVGVGPRREGETIAFALTGDAQPLPGDGRVVELEFPSEERPPRQYRELLRHLPPASRNRLPRAFDVVGDVVLIRLPEELVPWKLDIGQALLAFVPGARQVGWDRGVHGAERRRTLEPIAGSGGFRTRCRENGLELEVDLDRAYYSPRLASEHARVAAEVNPGERVLDLCCGIGPFSLTIARDGRAREVVSVDINPDAIELLRKNAERLGLSRRIRPIVGDVASFPADPEPAERAILNLPHEGIKYLASVGNRVGPAGTLHYYEIMERTDQPARPAALASFLSPSGAWTVRSLRVVHPYSPSSDLVSVSLTRSPEGA
ncbi:MAG TPA: class I SAM-dependent methyltransferase family protein [Thermoplasmata archaeon]|nr:class I SAM-dependent methyltransferase family protein [Thermoplasmata archaeon]